MEICSKYSSGQDTPQKEGVVYDKIILSSVDVSCTSCSHFSRLLIHFLHFQIYIYKLKLLNKIPNYKQSLMEINKKSITKKKNGITKNK